MAAAIATRVIGRAPATVRRFTTGSQHYVFDVAFAGRPSVVVRIGRSSAQAPMAGALHLSKMLRPRGVPLPKILAEDVRGEFPWLLMERLPGTDLGARITSLSDQQLDRIAAGVAQAQAITAATGSAGRYGYAARPEQAPHDMWAQVLDANLARSRQRMARAGLFDVALLDMAQGALAALRDEIDQIAPTPFLHDTTTKNVIVTADGDISGIVDVDDLCFGDPRYPAALTRAVLLAYGGPVRYVSFWSRHAGWSADDRVFRLYVTVFLLDLMAEHGQAFNGNERPSSPEVRAHLCRAFKSSLELVMS
jgi:aminoglycoside phosphotransferase (APT) family kinase protein